MSNHFLSIAAVFVLMLLPASVSYAEPKVTVLAELIDPPGNPAVGPDGAVFFSMHPFGNPKHKVMRLDGVRAVPFPDPETSQSFASVIGIQASADEAIWILDIGSDEVSPKLTSWWPWTSELSASYTIPREHLVSNSFLQDFAIDEKRKFAYIADMTLAQTIEASEPAIIIVDLSTGSTRRVLSGHDLLQPQAPTIAEGRILQRAGEDGEMTPLPLGLNPIAIDPANEWVYFATMAPGKLYRVPSRVLSDIWATEREIIDAIEVYAEKPSTDGIAVGNGGVVYLTNIEENAIWIADGEGTRPWSTDARLIWPDGLYVAPDGSVVATVNQLHRNAALNNGKSEMELPFLVVRIED